MKDYCEYNSIKDSTQSTNGLYRSTPYISPLRNALPQVIAVTVKNILAITFGATIGFPTILIPGLTSNDPNEAFHLNGDQISWISSINIMCVPLGCLLSGPITQPIGRRRAMQVICFPFVMCWLIFKFSSEVWHVYLALALTGFFGGLVEAPVFAYVAEIAQPHLRGMLAASTTLLLIVGILTQFLLGTFLHWKTLALVNCVFPVTAFCLLCFMPESPYWLIMKDKVEDARKNLAWLRGWTTVEAVEEEFKEIYKKQKDSEVRDRSGGDGTLVGQLIKIFFKKNFLWPLGVVTLLFFLLHFTGTSTLQTFAVKLFATLQAPIDKYHATILLGVAEFLGTLACIIFVHILGKRVIVFISLVGIGICNVVVGTYAHMIDVKYLNFHNETASMEATPEQEMLKWIPLVVLILIAFIGHCGIRVLPWILIGEIFSHETRATGCGVSGGVSYIFGFLANKLFLKMIETLTFPGLYWLYGGFSFFGLFILYFTLPETEGKTLEEITDHFSGISKLSNKIGKGRIDSNDNIGPVEIKTIDNCYESRL